MCDALQMKILAATLNPLLYTFVINTIITHGKDREIEREMWHACLIINEIEIDNI